MSTEKLKAMIGLREQATNEGLTATSPIPGRHLPKIFLVSL